MKPKTYPNVGLDFIAASGERVYDFQLCEKQDGRLVAVAIVTCDEGKWSARCVSRLLNRMPAIMRLAKIYMGRSVPQVFTKTAAPSMS